MSNWASIGWWGGYQHGKSDHPSQPRRKSPYISGLYHTPLAGNLDLTAYVGYVRGRYEWRESAFKTNDNTYSARVGVKYRPTQALQIHPAVGYVYSPKTSVLGTYRSPLARVEASYDFHPNFGVAATAGLQKGGGWSWAVGPRVTW